jgi:hypothetical protein
MFSPDGQRVGVGYDDSTAVDLLSGKDLSFIKAPDTRGAAGPNINITGWSADGRNLFAGGIGNGFKIRRWDNGGSGQHIDIEAANNTVMELLPLRDGGMLFAAGDPAFGIIDALGRAKILQRPGHSIFGTGWAALRFRRKARQSSRARICRSICFGLRSQNGAWTLIRKRTVLWSRQLPRHRP